MVTTATVPYGTEELEAKASLSTTGYAKLSDDSYIPVTISWSFNVAYDGTVAGIKALTGIVAGAFPGGLTPTNRIGSVTVLESSTVISGSGITIVGYYADNTGADTALTTTLTVPYGTTESAAKAGMTSVGYAKLSDDSYIPVTIIWNFDTAYDGRVAGTKTLTGIVMGSFPEGQIPTNRTGVVTVLAAASPTPTTTTTSAPPSPTAEKISIEVKQGNTDSTVSQISVERTTNAKGEKSDTVTYQEDKAVETVDKLKAEGKDVARIVIPDEKDEVSETTINIPSNSLKTLTKGEISLQIETEDAKIDIPKESLQRVSSSLEKDLYFHLVPVKEEEKKGEFTKRAVFEVGVLNGTVANDISVIGTPVAIETNMPSADVDITLPLAGVAIPEDSAQREAFLKQLAVFIEHSDGTKELVQGEIVEYKDGTLGIKFHITKFSTFVIVQSAAFDKSSDCKITKVKAPANATMKNQKITATVANKTSSLTVRINVSKKAYWSLYSDKACKKVLKSKKLKLKVGLNKVYIKVTAEDGITNKVYTLSITRKEASKKKQPMK